MISLRIAVPAAAIVSLLVAGAATAQQVRRFIRPEYTRETLKTSSPEDAEFLRSIPLGSKLQPGGAKGIPMCFWRSPLRTRGGYVDGELDSPMRFYLRAPFPQARLRLQGVSLGNTRDFAAVPYLDLSGSRREADGRPAWEVAAVVLPPMNAGSSPPPFTVATVKLGDKILNSSLIPVVPGVPIRVNIRGQFDEVLAGLQGGATLSVWVGRYASASDSSSASASVAGEFPQLAGDHEAIMTKLADMNREFHAGRCKVDMAECYDGACG